jgi:glutaconyl-CoA/methylmalonyl-CoA decarboxylase subunit gamma
MKYLIKIEDQTYEVEIIDLHNHPIVAIVDGQRFEIEPLNDQSRQSAMTESTPTSAKSSSIPAQRIDTSPTGVRPGTSTLVLAPIPGVIVALLVRTGDEVSHGQDLCTIEAMKMRNNIRAARPGRIAEILVSTGQTVNHNDPLLRYEEPA